MDKEELLKLYKDNVRVTTTLRVILKPKRYYKRPDLQRLANRWYGMVRSGFVDVDIYARPTKELIRIPFFEPCKITTESMEPKAVKVEVDTYKLRTMAFRFTCPEQFYGESLHRNLLKFWHDVKGMEFAQKI